MCLILFAYHTHPDYPLVVAANRDEFYGRPTRHAGFWPENPQLLAGKDLQAGGTWLGITTSGRFAAVTNFREAIADSGPKLTRGDLTTRFLLGDERPEDYLAALHHQRHSYAGFNLLAGDHQALFYYSNRSEHPQQLEPGIYGLSNGLLNTDDWPKVATGRQDLLTALQGNIDFPALLALLSNEQTPLDHQLPDTGVGIELERMLSTRFIRSEHYGTRATTVLAVNHSGEVTFIEQNFGEGGVAKEQQRFEFQTEMRGGESNN